VLAVWFGIDVHVEGCRWKTTAIACTSLWIQEEAAVAFGVLPVIATFPTDVLWFGRKRIKSPEATTAVGIGVDAKPKKRITIRQSVRPESEPDEALGTAASEEEVRPKKRTALKAKPPSSSGSGASPAAPESDAAARVADDREQDVLVDRYHPGVWGKGFARNRGGRYSKKAKFNSRPADENAAGAITEVNLPRCRALLC
jgi:hypothetical protein